ncbi:MAG: hypothetical protein IJ852_05285 [Alphaproteobacteria bacterium]|nr:hypothetical protein [Alphaproteobacteria bacterium]
MSALWLKIVIAVLPFLSYFSIGANPAEVCHVYIDLASTPSLMQAVNAVQMPEQDYKLLLLKRFHSRFSEALKKHRIKVIGAPQLGNRDYDEFAQIIDENLIRFYLKHPKAQYHIHLNAFHTMRSGHVFDIIPPKQIKSIHLYEDSYGRTLWDQDILEEFFVQFLKAPVFLHIGLKSQAASHRIKEKYIIQKTWRQMEAELTDAQKTLIAQIIGIDIAQMNIMFKDKPVAVFFDDPALTAEESRKFLQKLSENKEIKKIHWLYKNHPRRGDVGDSYEILRQFVGKAEIIPSKIPFEAFYLLGMKTDFAAGYGSSVFFSFDKGQILGYIKRKFWEAYLNPLLELGILSADKIYDVGEGDPVVD